MKKIQILIFSFFISVLFCKMTFAVDGICIENQIRISANLGPFSSSYPYLENFTLGDDGRLVQGTTGSGTSFSQGYYRYCSASLDSDVWTCDGEIYIKTGSWGHCASGITAPTDEDNRIYASKTSGDWAAPTYMCEEPDPCEDQRAAKAIECNGAQNIINWDEGTCTGDCAECTGDGEKTESEVSDECGIYGVLFYDAQSCSGACNTICTSEDLQEAQEECGVLGMDMSTWSDVGCSGLCNGCTPQAKINAANDCASSGGTLDESSYTCSASVTTGIDVDYVCQGGETTIQPPPNDPLPEPETPTPTPDPKDPETPSDDPTDKDPNTNPDIIPDYLEGLKDNSNKQLSNSNRTNELLDNIAENLNKSVENQALLSEAIQGTGSDEMLGKVYRELVGIEGELEDLQTGWNATSGESVGFEEQTLIEGEVEILGANFADFRTELSAVVGIDLQGTGGLPSWTLPTPFGDYQLDLNEFQSVFDAMGSVVIFAAYFFGAIIIFG